MVSSLRRLTAIIIVLVCFSFLKAQPLAAQNFKKENRPYKVLNTGKAFPIKSSRLIQHIMVWTLNGHRVVEQREINASQFTFTIPINDKIFFLMVGLEGGRVFTQKLGIQ